MKRLYIKLFGLIALIFPSITFAQATLKSFVDEVVDVVGSALMPLLFSAALAWFIWGVIEFIKNSDNPEERKKGKQRILWGIIALFVMIAYLGLTGVFTNTFFGTSAFLPQLFTNS